MASSSESTPLLPTTKPIPPKPSRTVTFNPTISSSSPPTRRPPINPTTSTSNIPRDGTQPMLSALNSKLRRRNSSGAPLTPVANLPKIGPQRTTRTAQKLKLLPDAGEDYEDQESGREVYSQFTRIKDPTARRDAARLGKDDRAKLPRVTAYCTASSYRLEEAMRWLKGRGKMRGWKEQGGGVGALGGPKLFDECIYSPYSYRKERDGSKERRRNGSVRVEEEEVQSQPIRRFSDSAIEVEENAERRREDLIDLQASQQSTAAETPTSSSTDLDTSALDIETSALDLAVPAPISLPERAQTPDFDTTIHVPEIFLFDYGVCVLWGLTLAEEQRFLLELAKFEVEKLGVDDVQTEEFNFYYTREYQARIYNDFISLREKRNYMTKLAISHALAQSTKTSLYEDLLTTTIATTQSIPATIAATGRINLTRREINMQIGELFILRINIHLQGSVLDAPELMWAEPQLEPVYRAVRGYLEMDQRVDLLQERLGVVGDLLAVLKGELGHTHGEYLEWIVIVLIAAEIVVAGINIVVDLYAGVD